MEADNFYMTLPSNASMELFVKNTLSEYKVQLPRTLHLNHSYETALVEITYPNTYDLLAHTDVDIVITTTDDGVTMHSKVEGLTVSSNVRKMMHKVNTTISGMLKKLNIDKEKVKLQLLSDQEKVKLHVTKHVCVLFTRKLAAILGFPSDVWFMETTLAKNHYDLRGGFHSLYVYCSAVESQIVGDVYAPLLRTVGLSGLKGETIVRNFIDPHYMPVNCDELRCLEMNIKDDTGENVSFRSGKVICKLHFRKQRRNNEEISA